MRIYVSDQGFTSATTALVGGNLLAVDTVLDLAGRLGGCAGMAGDDSTATDFAATYDEAAAASVAALQSLVEAFATLARLVEASLANHAHAEDRSAITGHVAGPTTAADEAVGVYVSAPASSLGADSSGPGGLPGVVLDMLQDVFWPNADTDRVRRAASTWSSAAESVSLLTGHLDSAAGELVEERSPEVPLVLGVLDDLRSRVDELSTQLAALGTACTEYADHVEGKRSELLSLLEEIAVEIGITAVVGGLVSAISGGLAGAAAGSVGAARLAAAGSRARAILDGLRVLTAGSALRAESVVASASEVATVNGRISRARVLLMEGRSAGAAVPKAFESPTAWVERQTRAGGHMAEKHIGKSDRYLRSRLLEDTDITASSTFTDAPTAHRAVHDVLVRRRSEIDAWLSGNRRSLPLEEQLADVVGRSMLRSGEIVKSQNVFVYLVRDVSQPEGFYIRTAFPKVAS